MSTAADRHETARVVEATTRTGIAAAIDTLRDQHVSTLGPAFDDGFTCACEIAAHIARTGRP